MSKEFWVYPYSMKSLSSRYLGRALDALRVFPDKNYRPEANHIIINWGNSHVPRWDARRQQVSAMLLNHYAPIRLSINKIKSFEAMRDAGVRVPRFTTVISEAREWTRETPSPVVVCRTIIDGQEGRGIVIAQRPEEVVQAPLYTKHVRHKHEFRVHVVADKVIDFAAKKKPNDGREVTDEFVRNHGNNWIFARNGIDLPEDCKVQAIAAVKALGLDFGAVDIAYRERENQAFVLEVNTAPGFDVGSTTLARYEQAFREEYLNV